MKLDPAICYQALTSHDRRFDGVFFVACTTTGIYCRNICSGKGPRRENCAFFPSAAAAERAGYRPCLRCRPELAPGSATVDAVGRLAATAAGRIEEGALAESSLEDLATELGVTGRHLRRVVRGELGVSPIELAQTHRLLLAKRLLTDSDLAITDVAFASGFASLRRFNALFRERYRMSPTDLRRCRRRAASICTPASTTEGTITCEIGYRPPMDWDGLLGFIGRRTIAGVEAVVDGRYVRTAAARSSRGTAGWLAVEPRAGRDTLRITISSTLLPALPHVLGRVKRLFDTAADPERIAERLGALVADRPGLRVPGAFDGFELAVRAVLGQQVSVSAARTLAGRFAARFGELIETPFPELNRLTPTKEAVAASDVGDVAAIGLTPKRAAAIVELARAAARADIRLDSCVDPERTIRRLTELPGIGEWTAQYIAMRALAWPDAFPHTDLGVRRALGIDDPRRTLEIAEAWRPWRAYATMHLWAVGPAGG